MKLGTKMFFCITIFFSAAFLFGGYILISYFYDITMEREIEAAVEQYQYNKFVVQANLITRGAAWLEGDADGAYDIGSMASDMSDMTALYTMDKSELFSGFPTKTDVGGLLRDVTDNHVCYRFYTIGDREYLLMAGIVSYGETGVYLVTGTDVARVSGQQEQMIAKFGAVYGVTIGIGSLLIFGLSYLLTKPVKNLTEATKKIADGNYSERVEDGGTDEVGQLARNFNRMALAVEEKVQELSDSARQKEDFVANFAHELKTPLTSMIGYADRIYHKEMPREEQKRAAWYIWNEGMRLEALSHKLMDMTVLNHKDFVLQETETQALFRELTADVEYLMSEKKVSLRCSVESA
ncbi:MAG: HAMP domain-containing protein, partial [Lachnospiraceae bacterium]|nr:HAMP domain-containing protein [Lachnospiraceae bacterium]